jgi:hypothetical protein
VPDFDKLKDEAQQYAQDHPEQVEKGEQEVKDKLGFGQQGDAPHQEDGDQPAADPDQ